MIKAKQRPLKEVADVIRGVTFSRNEGKITREDNTVPVIRAGNIQKQLLLDEGLIYVPQKKVSDRQRLMRGDIVVCTSSGSADIVGKTAYCERDWEGSFGAFCATIRSDESICDSRFLFHFLRSPNFLRWTKKSSGANIKNIRKSELDDFPVPIPGVSEQRRIVTILDKAEAIRRKCEQAIALTDDFLRSTFLEMFGDPLINPKGWPKTPLEEQANILVGHPFQSAEYTENGVRLCRGANTLPGRLDWGDTKYWPTDRSNDLELFSLQAGDVILALDRPWISSGLKVAMVKPADLPALLVQRVARVRGKTTAQTTFFYYALQHPSFWRYCKPTETTIPHISPVELRQYPLIEPSKDALDRFSEACQKAHNISHKMVRSVEESSNLFATLSQRAFSRDL